MKRERYIVRYPVSREAPAPKEYQIYDTVGKRVVDRVPVQWEKEHSSVAHGRALRICAQLNGGAS
jgi:hypothetical protein